MAAPAMDDGLLPMGDDEEEKKKRLAAGANAIAPPGSGESLALVPNQQVQDQPIAKPGTEPADSRLSPDELMDIASGGRGALGPGLPPKEEPQVPGGALTPEQEAVASTVPANANGDAVDKMLAANPVAPRPVAPLPPPSRAPVDLTAPGATGVERSKIYSGQQDATDAALDAVGREGQANVAIQQAKATEAEEHSRILKEYQPKIQKLAEDNERWRTNQLAYVQQQQDAFAKMEPKDYWADKSTGDKVLAGLMMVFGAAGRTSNADNPGMQIINQAIERDAKLQTARIEKQKANVAMSKEQYEMGWTSRQHALADLQLQQQAAYDATAADGLAMLMRQGIPLEQAKADSRYTALKQAGLDKQQELVKSADDDNNKKTQLELDRMVAEAKAKKAKGAGGGGLGSSPAVVAYSKWREEHPDASISERQAKAVELQIPFEAKAGHVSLARLEEEWNKGGAAEAKAAKGETDAVKNDFKSYRTEAVGSPRTPGPLTALSQLEAMRTTMDKALKSGDQNQIMAAVTKAKEQAGTMMSGGKMTNAQIQIMKEMDSAFDTLQSKIGHYTNSPQEGAGFVKRLNTLIDQAGEEYVSRVGDIRDRGMEQFVAPGTGSADSERKKKEFMSLNSGLYGAAKWQGKPLFAEGTAAVEHKAAASGGGGPVTAPGKVRYTAAQIKQAGVIIADPEATPDEKKKARAMLATVGN